MLKFITQDTEKITTQGITKARVDIIVDSSDELVTQYYDLEFTFGSRAWAVDEKTFYGLNSSGEWVDQKGSAD